MTAFAGPGGGILGNVMPEWPDDPAQGAARLRELAKSTPIEESPLGIFFILSPWSFLSDLSAEVRERSVREVVLGLLRAMWAESRGLRLDQGW